VDTVRAMAVAVTNPKMMLTNRLAREPCVLPDIFRSYAIAAFGAWALVAGALQLISGLVRRRQLGGQWAMILSGAQSCLAGVAFVLGGLSRKLHAKDLGGYAIFGAIYFCIAGVLLARKLTRSSL
jgi:hypothetical protein